MGIAANLLKSIPKAGGGEAQGQFPDFAEKTSGKAWRREAKRCEEDREEEKRIVVGWRLSLCFLCLQCLHALSSLASLFELVRSQASRASRSMIVRFILGFFSLQERPKTAQERFQLCFFGSKSLQERSKRLPRGFLRASASKMRFGSHFGPIFGSKKRAWDLKNH